MIKEAINKVINREELSFEETYTAINRIMSGQVSSSQMAAFLTGLAMKGETDEEISGSAAAMRDHAVPVETNMDTLDIVGTGGDKSNSFNISSTAALVIAAAGMPVSKHGNRSASSKSGAADCLEALGINLAQSPQKAKHLLEEIGICFLFAQNYHTSMKHVGPVRQDLGIRTVFNLLGPITNPARPKYQMLGVYKEELIEPMAKVIQNLGVERGIVVFGQDVMDEISISAPTSALLFDGDHEERMTIHPEDYGFKLAQKADIVGGTPQENAEITRDILAGKERGPRRDIVLLNAGAGLYISRKAGSIQEGIKIAEEAIDLGQAQKVLDRYIRLSQGEAA